MIDCSLVTDALEAEVEEMARKKAIKNKARKVKSLEASTKKRRWAPTTPMKRRSQRRSPTGEASPGLPIIAPTERFCRWSNEADMADHDDWPDCIVTVMHPKGVTEQKDLKKNVKNHVSNKHMDKVKLRKDRGGDLRQREKEELEGNALGLQSICIAGRRGQW
ncbi:hypothetical protein GJ744_011790 [Endocarpon pusillum]|uniref:Uncharacterized protein n=1 Tax=Endocarpon pusillum TaxID=364733 RepID=A0A8H7AG34_9EURO|nr:hypothetical protein GJ744_011790 [Endocarpon pusillum]